MSQTELGLTAALTSSFQQTLAQGYAKVLCISSDRATSWILSATKSWVTSASYADSSLVSARTAGGTEPTDTMLEVVLPWFSTSNAAISVGIAEAVVLATTIHLTGNRMEHLGSSLVDFPNLRARLAQMRIETDRARAHLTSVLGALESGAATATLMVLENIPNYYRFRIVNDHPDQNR